MEKTIGGDRLGSGNKNKVHLHNYERSTFNLSENFISSMCPGTLVPFYCNLALNGDVFDIDLDAMVRTIPTNGPLFGSFKLQLDVFQIPIRLYQALLHNNPINLGMQMSKVKLPVFTLRNNTTNLDKTMTKSDMQVSNSALIKYLGVSGAAALAENTPVGAYINRDFNAVPVLAYYDIFKNYYANKSEENAYIIGNESILAQSTLNTYKIYKKDYMGNRGTFGLYKSSIASGTEVQFYNGSTYKIEGANPINNFIIDNNTLSNLSIEGIISILSFDDNSVIFEWTDTSNKYVVGISSSTTLINNISIVEFPLKNIDTARKKILAYNTLDAAYNISQLDMLPYNAITDDDTQGLNRDAMNGLAIKTYQSDLFNNWVQTDWITGDNGISAITAVSTSGEKFTIDALNLASKVYNMLNRIAISGGTYEDWQEAVYSEDAIRHAESPVYLGGMSSEITFAEVVSTAATTDEPLGELGGKGHLNGKKGGKITCHVKEPSFIMGIVSITPRLVYSQGNAWYMQDVFSIDDLHKPALDGIGFQNLMCDQMAWFGAQYTKPNPQQAGHIVRQTIGKVPAWINYQTAVDKAYGDFAAGGSAEWMVLGRNYQRNVETGEMMDLTTYIDPTKFNYAFTDTRLQAQNFWVQISSKVIARRKMSSKIIPNL